MSNNGSTGVLYGGGGGGGGYNLNDVITTIGGKGGGTTNAYTTTDFAGGAGANGLIIITYTPVTAPTVTSVSPNITYTGNMVVISGTQFINVQNVYFGTIAASYSVTNSTSISATVPVNVAEGTLDVIVQNLLGTSANTSADLFTYQTSSYSAEFMNFAF